jgi:hypothetical protein
MIELLLVLYRLKTTALIQSEDIHRKRFEIPSIYLKFEFVPGVIYIDIRFICRKFLVVNQNISWISALPPGNVLLLRLTPLTPVLTSNTPGEEVPLGGGVYPLRRGVNAYLHHWFEVLKKLRLATIFNPGSRVPTQCQSSCPLPGIARPSTSPLQVPYKTDKPDSAILQMPSNSII